MGPTFTAVSAPGKVLLAGGYLVVDRHHTGLVFGLDARIHVLVQPLNRDKDKDNSSNVGTRIVVCSPQFRDAEWHYDVQSREDDRGIQLTQSNDSPAKVPRNKFVETTLVFALTYCAALSPSSVARSMRITILADSSYYSNPGTPLQQSQAEGDNDGQTPTPTPTPSRFLDLGVPLARAHKTGLGSSAALVTALSAAVLSFCLSPEEPPIDPSTDRGRVRAHNLAQAAHCTAQGKIGSGFDVAAAVFGTCVYRRFTPDVLDRLGGPGTEGFASRLRSTVDDNDDANNNSISSSDGNNINTTIATTTTTTSGSRWDYVIDKEAASMPPSLRLVMCDVDCGSETPGMVKKVFAWKKEKPAEAAQLWAELQRRNDEIALELRRLSQAQQSLPSPSPLSSSSSFDALRSSVLAARKLVREMGARADVPVEPPPQTALIDACCAAVDGVVAGVVPGAGGFDALSFLVVDGKKDDDDDGGDSVREDLARFLDGYEILSSSPSLHGESGGRGAARARARLLDVAQDSEGLRVEDRELYRGWI